MRKDIQTVMVVAALSISLPPTCGAGDDKFKIQDYIPEYFKDFEWKVGGGIDLAGSNSASEYNDPVDAPLKFGSGQVSRTTWNFLLRTSLSYDYETIPQFFLMDLGLAGGFEYESSERTSLETLADYESSSTWESDGSEKVISLDFSPRISGGKYYWGDFLSSVEMSSRFHYVERPGAENHSQVEQQLYEDPYFMTLREESYHKEADVRKVCENTVNVMSGWGRLYDGRFASTAMYIIEELRAKGTLVKEPSKEQMVRLCDLVYKNRLRHSVDERIRRIEVVDEISTYLNDAGLTDTCGHYDQLLIADVWDYFPKVPRRFGLRARGGFGLHHHYYRLRGTADSFIEDLNTRYHVDSVEVIDTLYNGESHTYSYHKNEIYQLEYYVNTIVEYSNPLNRQWQLDAMAEVRYYPKNREVYNYVSRSYRERPDGAQSSLHSSGDEAEIDYRYRVNIAPTVTYYYNSRTWLDILARYVYDRYKAKEDTEYTGTIRLKEYSKHSFDLAGLLTYRVSIPTTLTVTARYSYHQPDELKPSDFYSSISAGSYSLSVSLDHYLY